VSADRVDAPGGRILWVSESVRLLAEEHDSARAGGPKKEISILCGWCGTKHQVVESGHLRNFCGAIEPAIIKIVSISSIPSF
jgi:hypothetical protein